MNGSLKSSCTRRATDSTTSRRGLGAGQDRRPALQIAQQQQELVPALSGHHVGLARERQEPRGELDEQVVTGDVPQAVVDELEVVEVHEDHADSQIEPTGSGDRDLELLLEAERFASPVSSSWYAR